MTSDPSAHPEVNSTAHRWVMRLDRAVSALCTLAMGLAATALIASLFMIVYSVAMRYFINKPQVWVDDSVGFLLVAIVMLAAADVLRKGEHIGVDFLTNMLGARGRRIAAVWGMVGVLLTAALLMVEGWSTVQFSRMLGVITHGHVEIPLYWIQALLPIGGVLLGLAGLTALARMAVGEKPTEDGHSMVGGEK